MIFGAIIVLLVFAGFVVAVAYYLERLAGLEGLDSGRWFRNWVGKGLAGPVLFWIIWNTGIIPGLPPLMLQAAQVQAGGGSRVAAFVQVTESALFVIGSFWAAVTFAWFVVLIAGREDIRADFLGACFMWSIVLLPLAMFIVYVNGWLAAGFAAVLWLLPIVNSSLPMVAMQKAGPFYSSAIAKMKMGKYEDAEWEVLQELEKCEDDFDGWLMLAELYANHFGDLPGAERTIQDICHHPATTPSQLAVALHRLADWHLKPGEDPIAARRALENICQRLPETHLATMARQRIDQLPASREELLEQRMGRKIRLPALNDQFEDPALPGDSEFNRDEAAAEANRFVERLKLNPDDVPAREELARLFAERLDRADLGIEQIELLLEMPDQSARKTTEWLALMAAWQLKHRRDPEAARLLLQRLVRDHPQSAQAFAAQRHLKLMELEQKRRERRAVAGNVGA